MPARQRNTEIKLTNPDKLLWPKDGVTKSDLADYYGRMAAPLLRFAGGRPLSIIRAPDGIEVGVFFQRHHNRGTSARIGKVKIRGEAKPYLTVGDAAGLRAMAQWGVVELHPWGSTVKDIEHPDQIIFDLDPDTDTAVPFRLLKNTALALRERLEGLGLVAFVKLTGGKGLHVVVPLKPQGKRGADWKQAKAFTRAIAKDLAAADPAHLIAEARKAKRRGRIFIDYLRNDRMATAVACWSPRGRPGAPIAVPVSWSFLKRQTKLPVYRMESLKAALRHLGAWDDFEASRRPLTRAMLQRVGA